MTIITTVQPPSSEAKRSHMPSKHAKPQEANPSAKIVILSVNDVYDMIPNENGHGGIAEFATLLEQQKATIPADATLLVTLNGDFLSGSELAERFKGAHMIEIMNHLQIEYVVLGNHEFDFGAEELKLRMGESSAKWFGSNVLDASSNALFDGIVDTEIILLNDGLKLGIFGVCTEETPTLSFPGPGIKFDDVVTTSRRCVDELQAQGADFILALTHVSIAIDQKLARHVPGIDVILGGHDHEPFTMYEGKTLIHKSGQNAYWLAKLEFDIKRFKAHPERGLIVLPQWTTLETTLSTRTALLRAGESSGGNLVADALKIELAADVGFINGGFIRGDKEYGATSKITIGILKHEMPFPRPAVLVRIKASDLRDALLEHLSKYPQQSGSHPHVSGLQVTVEMHETSFKITKMAFATDELIDLEQELLVATSKFVADGGDGCSSWLKGEIVRVGCQIPEVVANFLVKKKVVAYGEHESRITIVE